MGASYIFAFQNSTRSFACKLCSPSHRIHSHRSLFGLLPGGDCFIVMGTRLFSLLRCRGILICHSMFVCFMQSFYDIWQRVSTSSLERSLSSQSQSPSKPVPSPIKRKGEGEHLVKNPRPSWPGCQYLAVGSYPRVRSRIEGFVTSGECSPSRGSDPQFKTPVLPVWRLSLGQLPNTRKECTNSKRSNANKPDACK
jgi:hypothetical protein